MAAPNKIVLKCAFKIYTPTEEKKLSNKQIPAIEKVVVVKLWNLIDLFRISRCVDIWCVCVCTIFYAHFCLWHFWCCCYN